MKDIPLEQALNGVTTPIETLVQEIQRLSRLSPLEYDQVRKAEADKLGIRISTLDAEVQKHRQAVSHAGDDGSLFPNVTPWPDAVDPEKLLDDILGLVRTYIICNTETAATATLWIAFTWFTEVVQVAPIALITAPEKRCGKSQLLDLIGKLASRPLVASGISPAAIFRVVEAYSPTLLIDEADTFLKDNEDARGIINSGHTRTSAKIIRLVGDNHEPKQFSTWGAKAISGIGKQADTIMDRSVILELRRKTKDEKVERLRHADPIQFDIFKRQLARFSVDAGTAIQAARPHIPESLNDRAQDNWEPLLAIADHAGGHWPGRARQAALKISGKDTDPPSLSVELLQDIQAAFEERRWLCVKSAELITALCEDDMKPWATYNRGQPMSPRQLANRLGEYKIQPQNIRLSGMGVFKGYRVEQFEDAFKRYIPSPDTPSLSATELQQVSNPDPESVSSEAESKKVQFSENHSATRKPTLDNVCSV